MDRRDRKTWIWVYIVWGIVVAFMVAIWALKADARDGGQWDDQSAEIGHWFKALKMPDNPQISCCGEADAYYCDDIRVTEGNTYCKITDDRDDEPLGRPHRPIGKEFAIPNHKLKWDAGNPTGHAVIFLSYGGDVYCFVQGTGI